MPAPVARVSVACRYCGNSYLQLPLQVRGGFCRRKCYHEWTRGKHTRLNQTEISCAQCGALTVVRPCLKGIRKYCSRGCMYLALQKVTGPSHANWDGGKTSLQHRDRASFATKSWKRSVLTRDGYKCVNCGATEKLHVHHIKSYSAYPELRRDPNNGLTLCKSCHYAEHTGVKRVRGVD